MDTARASSCCDVLPVLLLLVASYTVIVAEAGKTGRQLPESNSVLHQGAGMVMLKPVPPSPCLPPRSLASCRSHDK
jgi:hypothetical protein